MGSKKVDIAESFELPLYTIKNIKRGATYKNVTT